MSSWVLVNLEAWRGVRPRPLQIDLRVDSKARVPTAPRLKHGAYGCNEVRTSDPMGALSEIRGYIFCGFGILTSRVRAERADEC